MGTCLYCGQPAGWFRSIHKDCKKSHDEGVHAARNIISAAMRDETMLARASTDLAKAANDFRLTDAQVRELVVPEWEHRVFALLDEGPISEADEKHLVTAAQRLGLKQDDLNRLDAFTRIVKAAVIRDVANGVIPKRFSTDVALPFNFQKGEQLVWAFAPTKYLEDKVRRQFVGGSHGMSVRVAKGVYYRFGAFKGQPVEHKERVHLDTGILAVTNLHLYFSGPAKAFRVPYRKIISFNPFEDGIGFMRDAASAKAQIFVTGDGWFTGNLVTNLAQL